MTFHHREWSMQEIRRRKTLGNHVTRLHQLQRQLVRVGVSQATTDDDAVFHKDITLHELADGGLLFERPGYMRWNRLVRKRHRRFSQLGREHIKEKHLPGERFSG